MAKKTLKFDLKPQRLRLVAEKYYGEGDYISALRFLHKEYGLFGGTYDLHARIADAYENMGLQESAIRSLFRAVDVAESDDDLIDAYEGLAVNYMNIGEEGQSAYYYNLLINTDDTLTREDKAEIVSFFAQEKKSSLHFVYPPSLADFSGEMEVASKALKAGELDKAIGEFSKVPKGNRDFVEARQLMAVALLLDGRTEEACEACKEALSVKPKDVQSLATLAAIYLEQGRKEESLALAKSLCEVELKTTDELYKVATVCCENELDEDAFKRFVELEKRLPYDAKVMYFKSVAAYRCNRKAQASETLDKLCTMQPNAAVAKYYLSALRKNEDVEFTYFYRVPQKVREERCRLLIALGKTPARDAKFFGDDEELNECLYWCFDEMDGMDQDLQYIAFVVAVKTYADVFLREAFLDFKVDDYMKIEALRHIFERNEDNEYGMVLCNVYRNVEVKRIAIGRSKRKQYIQAYAKVASRFFPFGDSHVKRIHASAEKLYRALEFNDSLDLTENVDDVACAIYLLADLKEFGRDIDRTAENFGADPTRVRVIMTNYFTAETE